MPAHIHTHTKVGKEDDIEQPVVNEGYVPIPEVVRIGNVVAMWRAVIASCQDEIECLKANTLQTVSRGIAAYKWLTEPDNRNRRFVCWAAEIPETRLVQHVKNKYQQLYQITLPKYDILQVAFFSKKKKKPKEKASCAA